MSRYLLDNADACARERHACLGELYDPVSATQFDHVGVGDGWRCLELGAGNGSIAALLGHQVGPSGRVDALDLDTRWIGQADLPDTVTVHQHDLTRDPLPSAAYDLIHARLVLMHLPPEVFTTVVAALKPGGWLVVEELDPLLPYVPTPLGDTDRLLNRIGNAFGKALAGAGADNGTGNWLHRRMTGNGLVDAANHGHIAHGGPGSAVARLMRANVTQTSEQLVATGMVTGREVDGYLAALDTPGVDQFMPIFYSARARRPREDQQ